MTLMMSLGFFGLFILSCVTGGLGAVLRFWLDTYLRKSKKWYPLFSLLLINSLGSLVLGGFYGGFEHMALAQVSALWILAGALCGGFTTFSTAMVEGILNPRGLGSSAAAILAMTVAGIASFGLAAALVGMLFSA